MLNKYGHAFVICKDEVVRFGIQLYNISPDMSAKMLPSPENLVAPV